MKREITTDVISLESKKTKIPKEEFNIFDRLQTPDLVKLLFGFIELEYFAILKFVSREWYQKINKLVIGQFNTMNCYSTSYLQCKFILCVTLATNGQLNCLKWVRKHHCPWDAMACMNAAASTGQLDCLKWIRDIYLFKTRMGGWLF